MNRLRRDRLAAGLTQAQLAEIAGVSRQLVGAVEAGRHLPRVDAAVALATALGLAVEDLFADSSPPVDVLTGVTPAAGALVRAGWVGDQVVTAPMQSGIGGWSVADGVVDRNAVSFLESHTPGLVVAGCEPGLAVLERMLRETGSGAMSIMASSATAIEALSGGRAHAAVVHGPALSRYTEEMDVARFRLTKWQVGLAAPQDAGGDWFHQAVSGRLPVVQREEGAGVQRAFEDAAGVQVPGPRVAGHLEAAERAVLTGMPAVTIEPAALALDAIFEPLDVHDVEIWVANRWINERFVGDALNLVGSKRFQLRLLSVGGYDLVESGSRVAR